MSIAPHTSDPREIARFADQAEEWWNPEGNFATLHRLNRVRLEVIRSEILAHFRLSCDTVEPFSGLSLLDAGCGGGLVTEPMSRLGFRVTGIDASAEIIKVARAHAHAGGATVDYRVATVESVCASGDEFDAVLSLEVIEHTADYGLFIKSIAQLVRPGGIFIGATLNRTARSYIQAIICAEYLLGWLPRGTHDWRRFVTPSEFALGLRRNGLEVKRLTGIVYDVRQGQWSTSSDLSVNYLIVAARRS